MKARTAVTILLLLLFVFSCGKKDQQESDLRTFTLRGEVVAIDPSKTAITIAHEEVSGYMMAMTMPFTIKDPSLLAGVEVGDSITGTLSISKTERWIKSLEVTRIGRATDSLATGS
jgi:protein SCO1/2